MDGRRRLKKGEEAGVATGYGFWRGRGEEGQVRNERRGRKEGGGPTHYPRRTPVDLEDLLDAEEDQF